MGAVNRSMRDVRDQNILLPFSLDDYARLFECIQAGPNREFTREQEILLSSFLATGRGHARNRRSFEIDVLEITNDWLVEYRSRNIGHNYQRGIRAVSRVPAYNIHESTIQEDAPKDRGPTEVECQKCKESSIKHMRDLVPVPYAIFGAITLLAAAIFGTLLAISFTTPYIFMNPWVNLVYFIGSAGLFVTVMVAILDRKRGPKSNEK